MSNASREPHSGEEGDNCVLLGGMSSSRSPRPLPRTRTTQLHGDREWPGPGMGTRRSTRPSFGKALSTFLWTSKMCLDAARGSRRASAAGTGPAAQRLCLLCAHGTDSRRSCAADVEQLPDVLQFFNALTTEPEQVIEVPKILPEDVSVRTVVREPQPDCDARYL